MTEKEKSIYAKERIVRTIHEELVNLNPFEILELSILFAQLTLKMVSINQKIAKDEPIQNSTGGESAPK